MDKWPKRIHFSNEAYEHVDGQLLFRLAEVAQITHGSWGPVPQKGLLDLTSAGNSNSQGAAMSGHPEALQILLEGLLASRDRVEGTSVSKDTPQGLPGPKADDSSLLRRLSAEVRALPREEKQALLDVLLHEMWRDGPVELTTAWAYGVPITGEEVRGDTRLLFRSGEYRRGWHLGGQSGDWTEARMNILSVFPPASGYDPDGTDYEAGFRARRAK